MSIFDLQHMLAVGFAAFIGYVAHDNPTVWPTLLFVMIAAHVAGRSAERFRPKHWGGRNGR